MFVISRILITATRISRVQIRKWHYICSEASVKKVHHIKCITTDSYSRFHATKIIDPQYEVNYEDVDGSINNPKTLIIDVRKPDEVQSTGQIPSSINIPLDSLQQVLTNMSEEEFKRHFHRSKPTHSDEIIFYCKSGKRASKALATALSIGYSESKKYLGSWDEWSSRQ
ncbi:rhodanese domain-containing protein CG4456-like isoform X2 [Colias croceus]|uniref:rhodanese domain-containing protein CG4456-like isoform X2 n=1 Tax=Colias crocea TaxID=72248 RepID=UPI001E27C57D|nr:rhodanese domain-containing protein CG4456-like isoform X2 [Colias croceus]